MSKETNKELTLIRQVDTPNKILNLLLPDEQAIGTFATLRDSVTFTNKRLIVRDVQGVSGKKVESYSVPYTSIYMWSSETSGILDLTTEITIHIHHGKIKLNLGKNIDVDELDKLIAYVAL